MKKNISLKKATLLAVATILVFSACRKNNYYIDGGLSQQSEADKKMLVYDFLASRPNHMFDSLVKIIDLTNTKSVVNQDNITFFAAPNNAVMRLQMNYNPDDRQVPRALADIGKDTLLSLLNRFIIPNARITLEQAVKDVQKYYKAGNGDSLLIYGKGGGTTSSSSIPTSAYYIEYTHLKIPGLDSIKYTGNIQTHNLITANAVVHVLTYGSSFAAGLKQKYFR
ncbi:fasciclin domain-containing protein [Chitinophaga niastensis]|uniref:Fasciclin domain-containing protein n=1 Tax=Chitinophaga niastensis TaxID=536980 RepID=A0A2P8HEU0_CHINA|nr:fasciclin domain-containing protein [Chitinophaga niastensis]PSL44711.1 fasciclin domain-containing protein [Chitinophaga niastensis]